MESRLHILRGHAHIKGSGSSIQVFLDERDYRKWFKLLDRYYKKFDFVCIGQYFNRKIAVTSYMIAKVGENPPEKLIQEFKNKYLNT